MANFCTNCGNPVGENDGFCINCGQKILKIQGQTQPKTPAVNSSTQPAPKPPFQNGFSGAAQTAQPASRTAAQTGQTVSWKVPQVSGIVNKIRFPEGQR